MPKVFTLRLVIFLTFFILLGCSEQQEADTKITKKAVDKWNAKIEEQLQISTEYNDFEVWLYSNAIKDDKISNMVKSLSGISNSVKLDKIVSKTDSNCYSNISLQFEVSGDSIVVNYKVSATQVCRYKNGI